VRSWTLAQIVNVHKRQTFNLALDLLKRPDEDTKSDLWVLAQNLVLHGEKDLALRLQRIPSARGCEALRAELEQGKEACEVAPPLHEWPSIDGLAGFVYRGLFGLLLPQYAKIGIAGASEVEQAIQADPEKKQSQDLLLQHYQSSEFVRTTRLDV
jgi:hypothetical protein